MAETLTEALKPASVNFEVLHRKYSPMLGLVKELIGVIPNCDPTLEIWPPGFRTYNLLVPNMANLPNTLFAKTSYKSSVGLAMYAASKAACAYCTAHTCSFALRRGARTEAIAGNRTEKEAAVATLAERVAAIPSQLTRGDVDAAQKYFSLSEIEWLICAVGMMGFLNKFMDAVGVELEQESINETAELLSKTGWEPGKHAGSNYRITKSVVPDQDNLFTYLRVIRQAPGAVRLEKQWTRGVPAEYNEAARYLKHHTGYDFPILKPIIKKRIIRALTAVLRDNLSKELTHVGIKVKMLAATIFSNLMMNDVLASEVRNMAAHLSPEVNDDLLESLTGISRMEMPTDKTACKEAMTLLQNQCSLTEIESAALLLGIATSHTPVQLNPALIETALTCVGPEGTVEMVVWISVLQLLHRLSSYYEVMGAY